MKPTQPILMVSMCGTSVLTNAAEGEMRSLLRAHANDREAEVPEGSRQALRELFSARRQALLAMDPQAARDTSAELNGLLAFYDTAPGAGRGQRDQHLIVATATWQGQAVADMVREWLVRRQFTASVLSIQDLTTGSREGFQAGLQELVRWCEEALPGYQAKGHRVVFNLTGGFKSVNGFMQALGMVYADELVYLFEGSRELLRLPRLPVALVPAQVLAEHLDVFRRLEIEGSVDATAVDRIPETLVTVDGARAVRSFWGDVHWEKYWRVLYGERLLASPSAQIVFGEGFARSVVGLPKDRVAVVNQRIDDLARYLLHPERGQVKRLDLKPLQGKPKGRSTHELDAWADQDARRIFCHQEGGRWVLDEVGKALH